MALTNLKKSFAARAAVVGLSAFAAFAPLSVSYADSAGTPSVQTAATSQSTLTQEQRARVLVGAEAFDYAYDNPGHIAVSVLKGPDAGSRTAEQLGQGFERGIENRYGVQVAWYAGDNGSKPTEVTFHYLMIDTDNQPLVRSMGPYNMGDAMAKILKLSMGRRFLNTPSKLALPLIETNLYIKCS